MDNIVRRNEITTLVQLKTLINSPQTPPHIRHQLISYLLERSAQ